MSAHEQQFWDAPLDSLVDINTAAAGLKHQARWLHNLIAAGEGPPLVRISRKVLFRKRDVLSWLDARSTSQATTRGVA